MFTVAITAGSAVLNYFYEVGTTLRENPSYRHMHIVVGVVLMVSGFLNIFLIKGKKKLQPRHKLWVKLLHIKLILALGLTPLLNPILAPLTDASKLPELVTKVQFYLVLFMFLYSTGVKYLREEVYNNFEEYKEVEESILKLQEQYMRNELRAYTKKNQDKHE